MYGSTAGVAYVQGFNAATDVVEIQSSQAAGFTKLTLFPELTNATGVVFGRGYQITLIGANPQDLHPSNFKFV